MGRSVGSGFLAGRKGKRCIVYGFLMGAYLISLVVVAAAGDLLMASDGNAFDPITLYGTRPSASLMASE